MKTTILIVVKNEAEGIQRIIRSVKRYADEVIVVDGWSTDDTFRLAQKEGVRVLRDHGRGRGDGVRVGLRKAKGDILVCFDADGSHEPKDIPRLIAPIRQRKADLVIASRRTGGTLDTNPGIEGVLRSAGADFLCYLVNRRFGTRFTDILYSFRAIRVSAIQKLGLASEGFAIEQEMVVRALAEGLRVTELHSREHKRQWGISKLKTTTGIQLLLSLLWQLITIHTKSH